MDSHGIPNIAEVPKAVDGDGLQLSGWLATWNQDSHAEAFARDAFDVSLPRYLRTNPIVLHMHRKNEAPCGRVTSAHIDKAKGVYGTVLLPKPEVGTKAMDVYGSVKNGLLKSFSVGGFWNRFQSGGRTKLICERLLEVSLAGANVNEYAVAEGGVQSVIGVKALGNEWVPAAEYDARQAAAVEWVACRQAERRLALLSLRLTAYELGA